MSWQETTIGQLGRVVTGKTPPTKNRTMYDGQYMFVTPTDLDWQSYYVTSTHSTVTDLARDSHKNQFIPANSTVFTCIGNTIGKCGMTSEKCLSNQQINSVVPNDEHDPKFVYYLLNYYRPKIRSLGLSGGAAQPIINKSTFSGVKVSTPGTKIQEEKISAVLSAYDDLIENNRRRIMLLEEAARLMYREWFVHFRFPGHEHVKIFDGVPEGWELTTLGLVAKTNPQSHKKDKLPEILNYIDISSVSRGSIDYKTEMNSADAPGRARRIARHRDTIWSNVRPNLRAYSIVLNPEMNDVFSTGFTVIHAEKVSAFYLYFFTTSDSFVDHLINHATGTSYPAVRPEDFEKAEILVPTSELMESFEEFCAPVFDQIEKLKKASSECVKARDLLLPRLMDGRLEV